MVRARVSRIVSVVSGENEEIVLVHHLIYFPESDVEFFERACEAVHIATMAVKHVEIDEVHVDQTFFAIFQTVEGDLKAMGVSVSVDVFRNSNARENI